VSDTLPTLTTAQLVLRPFTLEDAPLVQRFAGNREVAANTTNIPHPYPDGAAEMWINSHAPLWAERQAMTLAITEREGGALVGAIGLSITATDRRAELGYWIGRPYWGRGFATEAGRAMVDHGLGPLGLHRVMARHLARNPASGRVMRKLGMTQEGVLRGHALKWGVFEDIVVHAVLA